MFDCFGIIREKGLNMISKELLKSVLGFTTGNVFIKEIETKNNDIEYLCNVGGWTLINIYELAYKCKEWAYKQGFLIGSNCRNGVTVTDINTHTILNHFDVDFEDFTEFEIKACQWILDNKED